MADTQIELWSDANSLSEIKQVFAPQLSALEWQMFCGIGKATGLNPFLREIWAVKYGNNAASVFIGRDGYRKTAQANPDYDYHFADAVYSGDDFKLENGEVKHTYSIKDRGSLVGAYCIVKRKTSTKPVFVFIEFKEYYQGNKTADGKIKINSYGKTMSPTLWDTKPATMIKKVAEAQGLRLAFQALFAGTYDENEDWTNRPATLSPVTTEDQPTAEDLIKKIRDCGDSASLEGIKGTLSAAAKNLSKEDQREIRKAYKDHRLLFEAVKTFDPLAEKGKQGEPVTSEVITLPAKNTEEKHRKKEPINLPESK